MGSFMDNQRIPRAVDFSAVAAGVVPWEVAVLHVSDQVFFRSARLATLKAVVKVLVHSLYAGVHIVHVAFVSLGAGLGHHGVALLVVPVVLLVPLLPVLLHLRQHLL